MNVNEPAPEPERRPGPGSGAFTGLLQNGYRSPSSTAAASARFASSRPVAS